MMKFLIGAFVGVIIASGVYFFKHPFAQAEVGRMLNRDAIYLSDGTVVRGWIISQDAHMIMVDTGSSTITLLPSQCKVIQHKYLLQYLRQLM